MLNLGNVSYNIHATSKKQKKICQHLNFNHVYPTFHFLILSPTTPAKVIPILTPRRLQTHQASRSAAMYIS